jgi:hypothetical protein
MGKQVSADAPPFDWLDNPLVRRAYQQSPEDATLLDVLDKLLETMHELEDRFPGVPFRDILSAPESGRSRMQIVATLRKTGASEDDIALVFGEMKPFIWDNVDDDAFELVRQGKTHAELVELGYSPTAATNILAVRFPLSVAERQAVDLSIGEGMTAGQIEREHGIGRATTRRGLRKQRYQEWLDRKMMGVGRLSVAVWGSSFFGGLLLLAHAMIGTASL